MSISEKGLEIFTEELDLGAEKILKNIEKLERNPYVKVGILEAAGEHRNSEMTVADIATIHEYGTDVIPERSFIRATMAEKESDLEEKTSKIFDKILDGDLTVETGLKVLGFEISKNIKNKIDSNIPPPLASSTIKAKTRAGKTGEVALVDTGQMRNAISHEVVLESSEGEE